MTYYFLQGFLLGMAYVAPIGMQNLYVINTALSANKQKIIVVMINTILFDISLALACFFGVGTLIDKFPIFKGITLLSGSIVVIGIGLILIFSRPQTENKFVQTDDWVKIIGICFAITWFNPQAIIDGSLLLGGFHASLPQSMSNFFILGVCTASSAWFLSLTTIVSLFRTKFNTTVIRRINTLCGLVIIFYGIKLGLSFWHFVM